MQHLRIYCYCTFKQSWNFKYFFTVWNNSYVLISNFFVNDYYHLLIFIILTQKGNNIAVTCFIFAHISICRLDCNIFWLISDNVDQWNACAFSILRFIRICVFFLPQFTHLEAFWKSLRNCFKWLISDLCRDI